MLFLPASERKKWILIGISCLLIWKRCMFFIWQAWKWIIFCFDFNYNYSRLNYYHTVLINRIWSLHQTEKYLHFDDNLLFTGRRFHNYAAIMVPSTYVLTSFIFNILKSTPISRSLNIHDVYEYTYYLRSTYSYTIFSIASDTLKWPRVSWL